MAFTHLALELGGEHISFRPFLDLAADFLATAEWTTQRKATPSALTRHRLAGTAPPVTGFSPTAFAMTAILRQRANAVRSP